MVISTFQTGDWNYLKARSLTPVTVSSQLRDAGQNIRVASASCQAGGWVPGQCPEREAVRGIAVLPFMTLL